jgi:FtsH-binding integral membrane protein
MSRLNQPFGGGGYVGQPSYEVDATQARAVATFFNAVYDWMAAGLALTAVVAWWVSTQPDVMLQVGRFFWAIFVVELILVGTISAAIRKIPASAATVLFLIYAALNGFVLSGIFLIYAHAVLFTAFLVTAGMFGAMTVYGMVTHRDLSGWGNLLFMGLIGIIIASVVSIFWHNSMLTVLINYVGVAIFVGLTAYNTQQLKEWAIQTSGDAAFAARLAISGALSLYLDFLNLFLFVLQLLGNRDR